MHVLLIHQAFASIGEPGGTRHHELARALARKGHRVTVITSPISYLSGTATAAAAEDGDEGVVIIRPRTLGGLHRSFLRRLLGFVSFMVSAFATGLRIRDVDVVWGTSPPIFQGVSAWALARLKGARFLFEVRDLWPDFAIAVGVLKNKVLIRSSLWLERFLYRNADQLIVNSPGYVAHVKARGAARVELLPNGADPQMFDPDDRGSQFRASHRLDGKFVALYAGAHGISNDLDVVLDAAGLLLTAPAIQFVLVGDGKEKPRLVERAAQMGLTNVTFAPAVPKSHVASALAAADACIAILKPLDEYKTTYPNKVFDYMAAGRPVVLAIEGVIREVVVSANCGPCPKPGSARELANSIMKLAADPVQASVLGRNGRRYLEEHFSRESVAEQLCAILDGLAVR
jgi:glycosyltransferase involved in cell wall biosynthesis